MNETARTHEALAARFEEDRARLRAVAIRMLGSTAEADDAVQEAWLRLARTDTSEVGNLSGWLTTVVARVCLDQLRSRKARREEPADAQWTDTQWADTPQPEAAEAAVGPDPEEEALLSDSVGLALLVVLDTLGPAERLAFVLHDLFGVSFDEIAPIVERSPAAARQLASRARRRVRGREPEAGADRGRRREVLEAFLAAARGGDFAALLAVLDPDVVYRSDAAGAQLGWPAEIRGAEAVAAQFLGRAQAAGPALLDGELGVRVNVGGKLLLVLQVGFRDGRISTIEAVAEAEDIAGMQLEPLPESAD